MMTTRTMKIISSTKKVPLGRRKMLAVVMTLSVCRVYPAW
jgi:hypothetical protein